MNRKYSIGFLIGMIVFIFIAIISFQIYSSKQNPLQDEVQKTQTEEVDNGYYVKEVDGYITVFDTDKNSVFEESTILFNELPWSIQEQIKNGYKLETEEDVYSFLENYSS